MTVMHRDRLGVTVCDTCLDERSAVFHYVRPSVREPEPPVARAATDWEEVAGWLLLAVAVVLGFLIGVAT